MNETNPSDPDPATGSGPGAPSDAQPAFRYVHTHDFTDLLAQLGVTLLVTTYQAGKLMAVRAREGRVSTLLRTFDQAMGLAIEPGRMAVGTRHTIWFLRDAPDIAPQLEPHGVHDACYVPRSAHVTGDIRIHEMAFGQEGLWFVNTRFSTLCTLDDGYSFVPRWRPPFISALAAEDRCHLNGLVMQGGRPRYVTALGESDQPQGWRADRVAGGVIIDVPSNQIVARGLSMPHSPRLHGGHLWVLNSGQGELAVIDPANGQVRSVARFPGYTRGLAFHDRYAFIGLSRIREKKEFGGLPLEQRGGELKCGVWVMNIQTGELAGFMEFQAGCEEIFAVEVLPDCRYPSIIGFQERTIDGIFIVPPGR